MSPDLKVRRALADIDAAKQDATSDVAECLDVVADLITRNGDPDAVLGHLLDLIATEDQGAS
ncbi:hypothetical protein [Streptomyces sp. NPDC006640]|uniref:hypothetical protein n=1 Tax=unclassified Streptomyces TaxID=2593676 RepID=UPI0036751C4A